MALRRLPRPLLNYLRGVAMGAADVVPGVSGGTIAFITGIYPAFISALKSIDLECLRLLCRGRIGAAWQHVNGSLLLALFLGIVTSIATLARLVSWLLETHPIPLWAFFAGLIAASIAFLMRQFDEFHWRRLVPIGIGALLVSALTLLPAASLAVSPLTIFLAGAVSICAMLLPGISGSFILLVLGFYQATLTAVHDRDIAYLGLFLLGVGVGFLSFSRVIDWLLHHHRDTTLAVMVGFLVGSLNAVWPWKMDNGAAAGHLVMPATLAQSGVDPQWLAAICACLSGVVIVLVIEFLAARTRA